MSRGPGWVQRAVLAAVAEHGDRWWTMAELAAEVYNHVPHRAEIESVRRAVKSLGAKDLLSVEAFDEPVEVHASRVDLGEGYAYRAGHYSTRLDQMDAIDARIGP